MKKDDESWGSGNREKGERLDGRVERERKLSILPYIHI
jgi:hypothetical protein